MSQKGKKKKKEKRAKAGTLLGNILFREQEKEEESTKEAGTAQPRGGLWLVGIHLSCQMYNFNS